jgi:hypothetical protein
MRMIHLVPTLFALAPAMARADSSMARFSDPLPVGARSQARIDAVAVLVGTGYMGDGPTARGTTNPEDLLRPDLHYHGDPASLTSWLSALAAIDAVGVADHDAQRTTSLHVSSQLLADSSFVELAHVQLGVDYQVAHRLEVAPVLGGGVETFLYQDSPTGYSELESRTVNLMGFAGLAGQFGGH